MLPTYGGGKCISNVSYPLPLTGTHRETSVWLTCRIINQLWQWLVHKLVRKIAGHDMLPESSRRRSTQAWCNAECNAKALAREVGWDKIKMIKMGAPAGLCLEGLCWPSCQRGTGLPQRNRAKDLGRPMIIHFASGAPLFDGAMQHHYWSLELQTFTLFQFFYRFMISILINPLPLH